MSVDTTTLIVLHPDKKYYVACVPAAENTQHNDVESIEYHKQSAISNEYVVSTIEEALQCAEACEEKHVDLIGYPSEYGIRVYTIPEDYTLKT